MVFSNLHTHNNQRDTIRAFPLSINKRREFLHARRVLLGNIKIYSYHLITTFTSINFPRRTEQRKIELRKGHFADILTAGAVGLSSAGDLTSKSEGMMMKYISL
jgi:hypothetical protein